MSGSHPIVEASGLGRRFGPHWVLSHVDLSLAAGDTLLVAGANGSGKTTLLRVLATLLVPSIGSLKLFDLEPHRERLACRQQLTLISHTAYLYDRLSAREMLHTWARVLERRLADSEIDDLLGLVRLNGSSERPVGTFSTGMRKRLSLLRARLEEPRLVLLDEPFAALDPEGQSLTERWIEEFRQAGTTVVMASHALARASRLCDEAILLDQGQIAWRGPASELLDHLGASP